MAFSKQDEELFKVFAVPRPIRYSYETFYSMRNLHSPEVSFFVVLLDSREGFCILLVAMIVVWLAMGVRDYYYMDALRLDGVLDYGMFLVASFLASSTALPMEGAENRRYMSRLSRVSILTTWMLAILPLSVYFRGEFTSRLAVTVPRDQMDTLEKLEQALDKAAVQPCILDGGCMSAVLSGIVPYRNETLLAKMQKAFRLRRPGTENVFNTEEGCLKCASKPGFACFTCKLEGCGAELFKRRLVESREPLNLAVATMPATKGHRLARAYDTLLQRLFETAVSPFNEQYENCEADKWLMQEVEKAESGQEIGQVIELSAFLATFACLMGLSLCVFCVELVFGTQRRKLRL
ncbi:hypothetical protein HPB50_013014 [Hyalomma asiaticum]|uniref:Uncharacterized protein n=1 Tax=Hyalomma asiaticum TaxID=266040 RepID=A0ACB7TC40_HYAAI|nr:hypothetical protein HPB50_013014 [Hyalomma asiaticum]